MNFYPSKILLFGEYTILLNGEGLAIPMPLYYMSWKTSQGSDARLLQFAEFLRTQSFVKSSLEIDSFFEKITEGEYLESNIPEGYGMGSSGAVCAAVYDRFGRDKEISVKELRTVFQEMESFFHGQSSGLDPLISYYKKPLWLLDGQRIIECTQDVMHRLGQLKIFILDSGVSRSSRQFVELFRKKLLTGDYADELRLQQCVLNHHLIQHWVQNEVDRVTEDWKKLSKYSLEAFHEMILPSVREIWEEGIHTEGYYLKLCGAGGGGFYLVLVENETLFQENLKNFTAIRLRE